jgi:tetratricopeptide (TPR) repeat protein
MARVSITFGILVLLFISCSHREANVKSMEASTPTALLEKGNQLYQQGDLQGALQDYQHIYNTYPTSREYVDAVIGLSRCYNDMGDYEKGMDLLYNLIRENMVPSRVPEIYNEMAKYYEVNAGISSLSGLSNEENDYEKAIEYYRKAINYPNSDDTNAKAYAQYRIGELYVTLLKFKDATLAFEATINSFPGTQWATLAQQRIDEMRQAVNTVLGEMKTEEPASVQSAPEMASPPKPSTTPMPADTMVTPKAAAPDTSTQVEEQKQTSPPDTSSKPQMELK